MINELTKSFLILKILKNSLTLRRKLQTGKKELQPNKIKP